MTHRSLLIAILFLTSGSQHAWAVKDRKDERLDFRTHIQPILRKHCASCHGPDKQESNFRVDSRSSLLQGGDLGEPAIVPADLAKSQLWQAVSGGDPDLIMPPEGKPRLTEGELAKLKKWIEQRGDLEGLGEPSGERTTDHWSFQPIAQHDPPKLDSPWASSAVDAFIYAKLGELGLQPGKEATRATLIRRVHLVMHGLPPTPEEVRAFVEDTRPDAYERLVEHVLRSPRYGERWARHWLDVVRFGETHGFETNRERPNAYHYRDYVIRAFNDDKPYDQFVREQIAGDAMDADAATGFLVAGPYDLVKSPDINLTLMQRQDELADMVNTTGVAFLGLTLGCARCHNHKFDPITQRDYYSIQAVFAGVKHAERKLPLSPARRAEERRVADRVAEIRTKLRRYLPVAAAGDFVVLDDTHVATMGGRGLETLAAPAGKGMNPPGEQEGHKDDRGGDGRSPNISGGSYTWWKSRPGADVAVYRPLARGRFRVWLSWGAGHASHTTDAHYVLDSDGDLATTKDQRTIAKVNQRRFANDGEPQEDQSLWSGLRNAGVHDLTPDTVIAIRGGDTGEAITADVIVLEAAPTEPATKSAPARPAFREPVSAVHNVERIKTTTARYVRFTIQESSGEPCIDELEIWSGDTNVALAGKGAVASCSSTLPGYEIHRLEHINDGVYGNGHSWISNEKGGGWIQIELPRALRIDRIEWARDRQRKYRDRLATKYVIEAAEKAGAWRRVASSEDRLPRGALKPAKLAYDFSRLAAPERKQAEQSQAELRRLTAERQALSETPMVYAGSFSQPGPTHRLYRGEPLAKREEVPPDALQVIGSLGLDKTAPEQLRRVKLAEWITNSENPLTPRVFVNRIWHYHFGRGLVDTPSDLGANGAAPTHPELLDWLAFDAIKNGWSMKHVHRRILLSRTFRQSSEPNPAALPIDADSRYLWRFPPRRLEAEAIRDCTLTVSGVLDLRMGGRGFSGFEVQPENVRHYFPKKQYGPEDWRRMIYMTKVRQEQDSVFGVFDCPDASQTIPKRSRSTTPLQSLNLFNSTFMMQQSHLFAKRLQADAGDDADEQVHRAFELAFAREPDKQELLVATAFVKAHGAVAFCRALLNANEFLFIP